MMTTWDLEILQIQIQRSRREDILPQLVDSWPALHKNWQPIVAVADDMLTWVSQQKTFLCKIIYILRGGVSMSIHVQCAIHVLLTNPPLFLITYSMVELEWASEWQALMLGLASVIIAVMTRGVQIARNCCYKCLFPLMNHANIVGKGNQRQQQNIIISILLSLASFNCSCSSGSSILHIRDQIGDIWASWYLVVLYRRRKWVIYQFQSRCNISSLIQPQYITTILQQKSINTNNTLSRGTDTCVIQSVYTSYKHTPQ